MGKGRAVRRAISDLEFMRKTHVQWAEWMDANPDEAKKLIDTGNWDDSAEHRRIVAMYDNAIACLRAK